MDNESIDLFGDDGTNIQLPSTDETEKENILDISKTSDEIDNAISGQVVKQVLISEESEFIVPNYLIDLSSVEEFFPIQMTALKSLIHPDGDTAVYIALGKDTVKLGMGLSMALDRIVLQAVINVFGADCGVYRNFEPGAENVRMTAATIGHLRLSI